jgi:arylsulfatase A-like enzyme
MESRSVVTIGSSAVRETPERVANAGAAEVDCSEETLTSRMKPATRRSAPSAIRRWLHVGVFVAANLLLTTTCNRGATDRFPDVRNLILVTLDTVRADHLGCYGRPGDPTPTIDRLAREGVKFDMAISQAAVTPVSHASILSGRYPPGHGLRVIHSQTGYRLPDSVPTLATILQASGWNTAAFVSSFTVSEHFGLQRGFDVFDTGLSAAPSQLIAPDGKGFWKWDVGSNQRRADATTDKALEWLQEIQEPYFLWMHYWDPHDPLIVPPSDVMSRFPPSGEEKDQKRIAIYDSEIYFVDLQLQRIFAALEASGQADSTMVVLTADHGQGLGEHDWWSHRLLYQEQIHIPLIVKIPGGPTGVTVRALVRSIDIFPTVLQTLGLDVPPDIDGEELLGLVGDEAPTPRNAYADALNLYDLNSRLVQRRRPNDDLLYSVIEYPWKLIYRSLRPNESELYNLESDPDEAINLYASEPGQADRLVEVLHEFGGFVTQPFGDGKGDPEALERLRALGYVSADAGDS